MPVASPLLHGEACSQTLCFFSNILSPHRIASGRYNPSRLFQVYVKNCDQQVHCLTKHGIKPLYRGMDKLIFKSSLNKTDNLHFSHTLLPIIVSIPAYLGFPGIANADEAAQESKIVPSPDLAGVEVGAQFLYLAALLGLVGVGTFFVVRQLLIRRELESAAKTLQDRVRTGEASPVEYFELGAIMLRKKFFVLAAKYLEQAIEKWDGDPQDLAQVHNALGFSLVSDGKIDRGIAEYEKAVKLQPGYVVAWNNLGSAYEKKKNLPKALKAYEQALYFDPDNNVAREYGDAVKKRLNRLSGVPVKYD